MSNIVYSDLVLKHKGKLNGSIFTACHTQYSVKNWARPYNRKSILQFPNRINWQYISKFWNQLTDGERSDWASLASGQTWYNKNGTAYHPTGQLLYLWCNQNLFTSNQSFIRTAPRPLTYPLITSASTSEQLIGLYELLLNFSPSPIDPHITYKLAATRGVSPGISKYSKSYNQIDVISPNTPSPYLITPQYSSYFGNPVPDKKIFFKLIPVELTTGFAYDEVDFSYIAQGGSVFKPTDIPGCVLWLNSDSGITKDGSDNISLWSDQSGSHNDFSQSNVLNQPLFVSNQLNGHPVLRFNGSSDQLINSSLSLSQPYTIFIVAEHNPSNSTYLSCPNNFIIDDLSNTLGMYASAWVHAFATTPNVFHLICSVFNVGNSKFYYDANPVVLGNPGPGGLANMNIGFDLVDYSYFLNGDLANIIIYDSELSAPNIALVQNYLKALYNI
jgi:hypothetical protein